MARVSPSPSSPSGSSDSHTDHESHRSDPRPNPPTASASGPSAPREKKRRRPALACEQCRRRKVRCDRLKPCGPCSKTEPSQCSYAPTHVPAARGSRKSQVLRGDVRQKPVSIAPQRPLDLRPAAVSRQGPPPPPVPEEIDGAIGGIRDAVHFSSGPPSVLTPSADGTLSDPGQHVEALREKVLELHAKIEGVAPLHDSSSIPKNIVRGYVHHQRKGGIAKARYFSQGHWMHGAWLVSLSCSRLSCLDVLLTRCQVSNGAVNSGSC